MSDLFVSYSHEDREWAARVVRELQIRLPDLTIFFDHASLRAGELWEQRIQTTLESTDHLLVLWSNAAKQSDWVSRELYTFQAAAHPERGTKHRLVIANLQGCNAAANRYQQVNLSWLLSAYPDVTAPGAQQWRELAEEIADALDPNKQPIQVPLVVLAATQPELEALSAARWAQIEADFGIPKADLLARYRAARLDWRPFAQQLGVLATFDEVLKQINLEMTQHKLSWRVPDASFWADRPAAAQEFINRDFSTARLAVLAIDPLSIYEPFVLQRLMMFQDAMASSTTVIMTLPPFGPPENIVRLRRALIDRAVPYFDDYFRRRVPARRKLMAQCGWNVGDWDDVQRHILAAADNLGEGGINRTSAFLRHS
jgi:TIR domain-containing protein